MHKELMEDVENVKKMIYEQIKIINNYRISSDRLQQIY